MTGLADARRFEVLRIYPGFDYPNSVATCRRTRLHQMHECNGA